MKGKAFSTPPLILGIMNQRIVGEFETLKEAVVQRAVQEMMRRAALCIEREGQHVEGQIQYQAALAIASNW